MITDEKRREIANELRKQAAYSSGSLGEWWQRLQEIVTGEIDFANPQETYRAIADLIDRPTCHNIADLEKESFKCSRCGCRVLALGSMPEGVLVVTSEAFPVDWYSCPVCGAVVLDGAQN